MQHVCFTAVRVELAAWMPRMGQLYEHPSSCSRRSRREGLIAYRNGVPDRLHLSDPTTRIARDGSSTLYCRLRDA